MQSYIYIYIYIATYVCILCVWCTYIPAYTLAWYFYRNRNINTGHGGNHSTDESFAVQTPAVNFAVVNKTVSLLCS